MKRLLLYLIIVILATPVMSAQGDNVSFEIIPPREVITGQQFKVIYRLNNAQGSSFTAPKIEGLSLRYGPSTSTSTSMQIINGRTSSSSTVDYTYIYYADKEGQYTIPEAQINVNGHNLKAVAKTFKVLPADSRPSQSNSSSVDISDRYSQLDNKPIGKDDIFVRVILNKNSAYENEAVECTLKLYTKYEAISSFNSTSTPTYEGFLVEDVPVQPELNAIEHYNGQNYRTAILRRYILYPTKTGTLTVTSGSYDVVVQQLERISQGYFYYTRPIEKPVKLNEYTARLTVKPLPSPAPASFNGAVGSFNIKSSLSTTTLRTNEAAQINYVISGRGNIKFLSDPEPEFPSQFELYSPNHIVDAKVSGNNMTGTVTSEFTFVPQYPGDFTIPAYEFSYFDTEKNQYVTLTTESYDVRVAKGVGTSAATADAPGVTANATDIRHIHLGAGNLSSSHSYIVDGAAYWIIFVVLTICLVAIIVISKQRDKANADTTRRRIAKANKVARKHLTTAEKYLKSGNNDMFYDSLLKAMWGYLADRLNMQTAQLVRDNVADKLSEYGADDNLIKETIGLLDDCEIARYTPDMPELAPNQLIHKAENIINNIESIKH